MVDGTPIGLLLALTYGTAAVIVPSPDQTVGILIESDDQGIIIDSDDNGATIKNEVI